MSVDAAVTSAAIDSQISYIIAAPGRTRNCMMNFKEFRMIASGSLTLVPGFSKNRSSGCRRDGSGVSLTRLGSLAVALEALKF